MRELSEDDFIEYDIHLAKQILIQARIARQKATITKEFALINPYTVTLDAEIKALEDEAADLRKTARALLRDVERLNGKRYLEGEETFPLKDYLKGKFFKAWQEFDVEYARIGAPFFFSDPE